MKKCWKCDMELLGWQNRCDKCDVSIFSPEDIEIGQAKAARTKEILKNTPKEEGIVIFVDFKNKKRVNKEINVAA